MRRLALTALLPLMFSLPSAWAGNSVGKVAELMIHQGDVVIFTAGPHVSKPACSTSGDGWALSLANETGKAMYALLLSAQARGQLVSVNGTGSCSAWADREAPRYLYVNGQ